MKINTIVDHFFRQEYGKLVSIFCNKYGVHHISSIEDAIQDTLMKAMQLWPFKGIPKNPSAWIFRSANNRLIDYFRRASKIHSEAIVETWLSEVKQFEIPERNQIEDDQLRFSHAVILHSQKKPRLFLL